MRFLMALIAVVFSVTASAFLIMNGVPVFDSTVLQLIVLPLLIAVLIFKFSLPNWVSLLAIVLASGTFFYHFSYHWRGADVIVPAFAINNGDSKAALFIESIKIQAQKIDSDLKFSIRSYPFPKTPEGNNYSVVSGTPRWLTIKLPKSNAFTLDSGFAVVSDTSEVGLMLDKEGATVKFLALMFLAKKQSDKTQMRELLVKAVRNQGRWASQTHRAWPLFLLGNSYLKESDGLDKALDYYSRAHKLFQKNDHARLKIDLVHNFGVAQYAKGVRENNRRIKKAGANKIRRALGLLPKTERKNSIFRSNLGKLRDES